MANQAETGLVRATSVQVVMCTVRATRTEVDDVCAEAPKCTSLSPAKLYHLMKEGVLSYVYVLKVTYFGSNANWAFVYD